MCCRKEYPSLQRLDVVEQNMLCVYCRGRKLHRVIVVEMSNGLYSVRCIDTGMVLFLSLALSLSLSFSLCLSLSPSLSLSFFLSFSLSLSYLCLCLYLCISLSFIDLSNRMKIPYYPQDMLGHPHIDNCLV